MILHIMAPFRTHLKLYDEEVIYYPEKYAQFWQLVKDEISDKDYGFKSIFFAHAITNKKQTQSRFRTVDQNSLAKPLEILHITGNPHDNENEQIFEQVTTQLFDNTKLANEIELIGESVSIKIFNNSVGILELDVKTNNFLSDDDKLKENLDLLQEFAVTLGEKLSQKLYTTKIEVFLRDILDIQNSRQFIVHGLFEYDRAIANNILAPESTPEDYSIIVNWVTRSLLFDSEDEKNRSEIIKHWLKDSGNEEMIEEVISHSDKCAYRWLNYLFRENAYSRSLNPDGTMNYTRPFSDVWDAMLISQYYYCAFESLNDSLDVTLATAFLNYSRKSRKNTKKLKHINRKLEREIIDSQELLIEYQKNFAYYKRSVGNYIKEILEGWDFESSILNQVKEKIELCEQRMDILHQRASEKSALYSDLLLLAIAVISVVAFMFQVIDYGRNISHNPDLAVYESNSMNLVNLLSERPTDFAITISLGLMIVIFLVYYIFRRDKVLD